MAWKETKTVSERMGDGSVNYDYTAIVNTAIVSLNNGSAVPYLPALVYLFFYSPKNMCNYTWSFWRCAS